jgi:menaquinone-dependent protoporphyrinogen IX oxidase
MKTAKHMKSVVIYYSRKGSNAYLAKKISDRLSCDMEAIRPRLNAFGLFLMNLNPGIHALKRQIAYYDRIILVGPIFMGHFIPPLRSFVKKYNAQIKEMVFVTCCGSTYQKKDEKFGHALVFKEVKNILNDRLILTQAFPVGLVLPESQQEDADAFMKTHLNDSNFMGKIADVFEDLMEKLSSPVPAG